MSDNSQTSPSKRAISEELENILYQQINLLDKGFVRVIDYMGNDSSIAQAARVSYGEGTKTVSNDRGLIRYLMKHHHTSPFEMCEIKLHIKAPIFVARQWVRHRTANINEYSGRYSLMKDEFYIPEHDNIAVQSKDNKQGRGLNLAEKDSNLAENIIKSMSEEAYKQYQKLLTLNSADDSNLNQDGLARELARIVLPLNNYTEFYWKIDLHNLFHFLALRTHKHSQYEIRVYAEAILNIVKLWVPTAYQAFIDYKQQSVSLSKEAYAVIKDSIANKKIYCDNYKLSKREWLELKEQFKVNYE